MMAKIEDGSLGFHLSAVMLLSLAPFLSVHQFSHTPGDIVKNKAPKNPAAGR
jgi:hypothetical protein